MFTVALKQSKKWLVDMSDEGSSFWLNLVEKIIGLFLIALSIVMIYLTATSTTTLDIATGLFAFLSAVILIGGVFLIIVKPPE